MDPYNPRTIYYRAETQIKEENAQLPRALELESSLVEQYNCSKRGLERSTIEYKLKLLNETINIWMSDRLYTLEKELKPILEAYDNVDVDLEFFGDKTKGQEEKMALCKEVNIIVSKYVEVRDFITETRKVLCECGAIIESNEDVGMFCYSCKNTKYSVGVIDKGKVWSMQVRTENMKKSLVLFEGKNLSAVPDSIILKIRNICSNNKVEGKDRNHKTLYGILSKIGLSKYDKNINMIGHVLWDWPLPYIADVLRDFLEIFEEIQCNYFAITKVRRSSLGEGYIKYQIFNMLGKDFPKEWFKIVGDADRLDEYDNLWKSSCAKCINPKVKYIAF